jgi:hypothetical protein
LLRGLTAGVAGTAALFGLAALERRAGRRPGVTDPARMAGRLGRRLGVGLSREQRRWAGTLMRWPYGASWAVALSAFGPRAPWPLMGLALGGVIWLFELGALPRIGATPPLHEWERGEVPMDLVRSWLYGLVVAGVLARRRLW